MRKGIKRQEWWVVEYNHQYRIVGFYPWLVRTIDEMLEDNLIALQGDRSNYGWSMIGGPFLTYSVACKYIDKMCSTVGGRYGEE